MYLLHIAYAIAIALHYLCHADMQWFWNSGLYGVTSNPSGTKTQNTLIGLIATVVVGKIWYY